MGMEVTMAYIEEPDIPVGMTAGEFRRRIARPRRRGLLALLPRAN